jgi:hypothetical protein
MSAYIAIDLITDFSKPAPPGQGRNGEGVVLNKKCVPIITIKKHHTYCIGGGYSTNGRGRYAHP